LPPSPRSWQLCFSYPESPKVTKTHNVLTRFAAGTGLKNRLVSVLVPRKLTSPSVSKVTKSQDVVASFGMKDSQGHITADEYARMKKLRDRSIERDIESFAAQLEAMEW
jgi:hypothetical protein